MYISPSPLPYKLNSPSFPFYPSLLPLLQKLSVSCGQSNYSFRGYNLVVFHVSIYLRK